MMWVTILLIVVQVSKYMQADFLDTTCPDDCESSILLRTSFSKHGILHVGRLLRHVASYRSVVTPYIKLISAGKQDGDYFVHPHIIRALCSRMHLSNTMAIHLEPPNEMLTSQLRTINADDTNSTTFAWLGYGTIVQRSRTVELLSLLEKLNLSQEEQRMADNYFSISSNTIPQRWFAPAVELGGGNHLRLVEKAKKGIIVT